LLCYNFAPITLGLLLIRFSDIQNSLVTVWHYLAFFFDVWLVWKLRLALKDNENNKVEPTIASIRLFFRDITRHGLRGVFGFLILFETLLTVSIGGTRNNVFVQNVQPFVIYISGLGWIFPSIEIDPSEVIWKPDKNALETEAKIAGYNDDWRKYFEEHGKGFLPATTSLRFARLPQQILKKAQLHGAQLQRADLVMAQLQGADLSKAQLQGAYLGKAQLQGAYLEGAKLQGAYLEGAQLQGADLYRAQLQGADLEGAQLQGADLEGAQLQGADLYRAQLQGADLSKAQLQGAMVNKTGIVGIRSPSSSSVFSIKEVQNMFNETQPDWAELEAIAGEIPDTETRKNYLEKISEAKNKPSVDAKTNWKHNPLAIAGEALPIICKAGLESTRAFRSSYHTGLMDLNITQEREKELLDLIKDIDKKICTLEECKKLRDNIEGLNCKAK
jgi:hypothetical protein